MPCITRSALVPFRADQMFALVDDIDSYREFLPWCGASKVLLRDADEVKASIQVQKGGFTKSFTTHNRLQHNKMIEMRLVEGPFRHLEGFWRFDGLGEDACKVSLDIEFEFSNKFIDMTFGPVFSQIVNSLVDAFIQRAMQIYGKR